MPARRVAERDEQAVTAWKEATWAEVKEPGRPAEATSAPRRSRVHPPAAHRTHSPRRSLGVPPGAGAAASRSWRSAGAARGACRWPG
ncbi:hypothetical protein ACFP2V_35770 [Streptomyces incanus]|uniref:Transposase n=1 Tax=Streptomyces incanus TaxID=887453 RepID=A0ABW0Y3C2_9ACTN